MKLPKELRYTASHEWVRREGDGTVSIGITDHAQEQLGDVVFVEAPQPGRKVAAGESVGVVESVKAASDIYAPVSGEVIEVNSTLPDNPSLLNTDPHGSGWIFKLAVAEPAELKTLMDAAAYQQHIA